mgnify:CR=1 FL=1
MVEIILSGIVFAGVAALGTGVIFVTQFFKPKPRDTGPKHIPRT